MPDIKPLDLAYLGQRLHIDMTGIDAVEHEAFLGEVNRTLLAAFDSYLGLRRSSNALITRTRQASPSCDGHDTNCNCDGGCR